MVRNRNRRHCVLWNPTCSQMRNTHQSFTIGELYQQGHGTSTTVHRMGSGWPSFENCQSPVIVSKVCSTNNGVMSRRYRSYKSQHLILFVCFPQCAHPNIVRRERCGEPANLPRWRYHFYQTVLVRLLLDRQAQLRPTDIGCFLPLLRSVLNLFGLSNEIAGMGSVWADGTCRYVLFPIHGPLRSSGQFHEFALFFRAISLVERPTNG